MIQVCVISDSHGHILKKAWPRIVSQEFSDIEITFFAAGAENMDGLALHDGQLVATTDDLRKKLRFSSNGLDKIAGTFDFYIVFGMALHIAFALEVFRDPPTDGNSNTSLRERVSSNLRESLCLRTLHKVRGCTPAPIVLLAAPHQPRRYADDFHDIRRPETQQIAIAFRESCNQLASEAGAVFVPQSDETIAPDHVTTKMVFANPSHANVGRTDRWHTNERFGAIALRLALQRGISELSQSRANI